MLHHSLLNPVHRRALAVLLDRSPCVGYERTGESTEFGESPSLEAAASQNTKNRARDEGVSVACTFCELAFNLRNRC